MYRIKLKIANTVIELKSRFKMQPLDKAFDWRYKCFIYKGNRKSEITLWVEIAKNLPFVFKKERLFQVIHSLSGDINWSLFKKGDSYIIEQCLSDKRQCAVLNKDFNQGRIYLLSNNDDEPTWDLEDIIYDLLQIILINYFSNKEGIFIHSIGLKDVDKEGVLFIGPTRSGKTTTARLWHKYTKAEVLNDDRMIIRKINGRFFIFGTPWHGDFDDYLKSTPDRAELKRIFFIYHHASNKIRNLKPKDAFKYLYPNIFPTFWNKENLEKQVSLCQDLVWRTPSCRLGFKKDKSIISFVRLTG